LGLIVACLAATLLASPKAAAGAWSKFDFDILGWLTFVFGCATRCWSAMYRTDDQRRQLAMYGPYSICRHPVQWGNLLLCISLACFLGSLTCLFVFAAAAIGYSSLTIPAEEQKLRDRFGDQYDRYCQRVPRLWLRVRSFDTPENILLDIGSLTHELRHAAIWMWLPVLGKAAAYCRAVAWWPHLFRLP
jgi:protein-S-isoprenylcysteine O-methyltransferase Ste14